jgi:zinc protease
MEINLRENGFWAGQLLGSVQNDTDPTKVTRYLEELDKVSIESVKAAANKYLKEENFYKFILLPDAK